MLLKTALRNLKRNPVMNIICLVQLVAVLLITAVMVSTMSVRYRTYNPVREILESNGIYCSYSSLNGALKPGGFNIEDTIYSTEELKNYSGADKVITIRTALAQPCAINGGELDKLKYDTAFPLFYDNELLTKYKPELKDGRWIFENSNELEIVIPEGLYGAKIGDIFNFEIVQLHTSRQIKARVVGILKEGAEILGRERSRTEADDNYRIMYKPYYVKKGTERNPLFLASAGAAQRLYPDVELLMDTVFYLYDNLSETETEQALRDVVRLNSTYTIPLDKMNSNSKTYLKEQLLQLLPIAVVLLILVIVSAISVSAISARQRLGDYAKFYLLGLRWKQCAAVNFFQALIIAAAAVVVSAVFLAAAKLTQLSENIMIIINPQLALSVVTIILLYLVFSMIMPLLMIGAATPKQLLQEQSGG